MHGRGEKCVQDFGEKAQRKKDYLKDQGIVVEDGIKMDRREIGWGEGCGVYSPGSG
jgi:hypothetical protein